ncbi:heparinase II/III family protein [Neorhizobium sp. NCHU2750]|uniref:heparinase II/III family protein n=1 Tax=Neorhizobium sp. NCHU2750 TaxID=1825976 RepID=UPI000E755589|nr:heparinase [Neorhizobium sp. NCHU2750]
MRLADRRRLLACGMREMRRRLRLRMAPYRVALSAPLSAVPERLIVAPTDLRPVDPFVAHEIFDGRFPLAGRVLETLGDSPFELELPSRAFAERLHGFGWLRHIRAERTEAGCAHARHIVSDWINIHGRRRRGIGWEPNVVATRVIAWLSHSTIVLHAAEAGFYRRFMKSLAYQISYLRKIAASCPDAESRLRVRTALAMASLALPTRVGGINRESLALDRELDRQILADGGHISRNPRAILDVLVDLLPLRQTYINLGYDVPQKLIPAIDRMYPALRFFRHQDGDLALFNGASSTSASELMSVLRYDESAGKPFKALPQMQYHRLAADNTIIIVDTGCPEAISASTGAHAGTLSFEMSSGRHRFIVNSGAPKFASRFYRHLARSTAAHSTLTLGDVSSSRVINSNFTGPVLMPGVSAVDVERWDDKHGNDWLRARHDGYLEQFDYTHEREIALSATGDKIKGCDRLIPREGGEGKPKNSIAFIRFHIHPAITITRRDAESVALRAADGQGWIFAAPGLDLQIDEDVFFADVSGMRPSQQLVLESAVSGLKEIRWMLRRGE